MYLWPAYICIKLTSPYFSVTIVLILCMSCVNATRCTVLTDIKARTIDRRSDRSRYTRESTPSLAPFLQREEDLGHRHAFWVVQSALFDKGTTTSHHIVLERFSHWVHFFPPLNYLTLHGSEIDVSMANDHSSWNNWQYIEKKHIVFSFQDETWDFINTTCSKFWK